MTEANEQSERIIGCGCAACVSGRAGSRAQPRRSSSNVVLGVALIGVLLLMLYLAWPVFDDLGMLH